VKNFDVTIIGAGIVGLATGLKLLERKPGLKIAIVDKEEEIAKHQTGNNSGVIHSGIYYKPGNLKAKNCRKGYQQLVEFCNEHSIKYDLCGKVIVATKEDEREALDNIFKRGIENGLDGLRKIGPEEVREIEPHVSSIEAIFVPQAGIINYKEVSEKYGEIVEKNDGQILLGQKVENIFSNNGTVTVETDKKEISSKLVVNCAGLYSDKVAKMTMPNMDVKILPFRGEYYELKTEAKHLAKNLVYPVPNPNFPFLGVHFTRMINGGVEAGPNAVLAFRREGYKKSDVHLGELWETLSYSGFLKIAQKYWQIEVGELYRSFSKRVLFLKQANIRYW